MTKTPDSRGDRAVVAWLLRCTRPVLGPLWLSGLCRVVDQLLGVAIIGGGGYLATRVAVARLAPGEGASVHGIGWWLVLLAVGCLAKGFWHYGEQFAGHYVAFKALELLRAHVFTALIPRSPAALAAMRSGDLLARITTDIDRIEVFFAHTLVPAAAAVIVPALVIGGVAVVASPLMAGTAAALFVLAYLVFGLLGNRVARQSALASLGVKGQVTQHAGDTIQGITEVVGYNREADRLQEFAHLARQAGRTWATVGMVFAARRGIGQLCYVGVLVLPLAAFWAGTATFGPTQAPVAIGAALALWRSWEAARGVEDFATAGYHSLASARRVYELCHSPILVTDGPATLGPRPGDEGATPPRPGPACTWEDVTFAYPDRRAAQPALRGVSVTAEAGKWTALVGATGCGKSSLVSLLLRYWDSDAGRVLVGGTDIRAVSVDSLRSTVGVVTQRTQLFAGTVADNLRLVAPGASTEQLTEVLAVARLTDEVELSQNIGERGRALSGGQRQRLAVARMLLARPGVVVLDEFAAHLNPELAACLRRGIRDYLPGATVVEVTHTLADLAATHDWVVVMDRGRVLEQGLPAELLAQDGALARLAARGARPGN